MQEGDILSEHSAEEVHEKRRPGRPRNPNVPRDAQGNRIRTTGKPPGRPRIHHLDASLSHEGFKKKSSTQTRRIYLAGDDDDYASSVGRSRTGAARQYGLRSAHSRSSSSSRPTEVIHVVDNEDESLSGLASGEEAKGARDPPPGEPEDFLGPRGDDNEAEDFSGPHGGDSEDALGQEPEQPPPLPEPEPIAKSAPFIDIDDEVLEDLQNTSIDQEQYRGQRRLSKLRKRSRPDESEPEEQQPHRIDDEEEDVYFGGIRSQEEVEEEGEEEQPEPEPEPEPEQRAPAAKRRRVREHEEEQEQEPARRRRVRPVIEDGEPRPAVKRAFEFNDEELEDFGEEFKSRPHYRDRDLTRRRARLLGVGENHPSAAAIETSYVNVKLQTAISGFLWKFGRFTETSAYGVPQRLLRDLIIQWCSESKFARRLLRKSTAPLTQKAITTTLKPVLVNSYGTPMVSIGSQYYVFKGMYLEMNAFDAYAQSDLAQLDKKGKKYLLHDIPTAEELDKLIHNLPE